MSDVMDEALKVGQLAFLASPLSSDLGLHAALSLGILSPPIFSVGTVRIKAMMIQVPGRVGELSNTARLACVSGFSIILGVHDAVSLNISPSSTFPILRPYP